MFNITVERRYPTKGIRHVLNILDIFRGYSFSGMFLFLIKFLHFCVFFISKGFFNGFKRDDLKPVAFKMDIKQ